MASTSDESEATPANPSRDTAPRARPSTGPQPTNALAASAERAMATGRPAGMAAKACARVGALKTASTSDRRAVTESEHVISPLPRYSRREGRGEGVVSREASASLCKDEKSGSCKRSSTLCGILTPSPPPLSPGLPGERGDSLLSFFAFFSSLPGGRGGKAEFRQQRLDQAQVEQQIRCRGCGGDGREAAAVPPRCVRR